MLGRDKLSHVQQLPRNDRITLLSLICYEDLQLLYVADSFPILFSFGKNVYFKADRLITSSVFM